MILLASASAVRARLLREAGVRFQIVPAGVDEDDLKARMLRDGAGPPEIASALARAKALGVNAGPGDLVIGADQTLDLDGRLIDKARDLAEVRARLRGLRGRTHSLHAAIAIARGGATIWETRSSPRLTMRAFSESILDAYLADCGDAVLSSVGCYHLEGHGAQLFERIEGDYFAVLGLPLIELLGVLRRARAMAA